MQPPQTTLEYNVGEEGGASLNSKLCEFGTSLWPSVGSIYTNHLHFISYAGELIKRCPWKSQCHFIIIPSFTISYVLSLVLVWEAKEHAPSCFYFHDYHSKELPLKALGKS